MSNEESRNEKRGLGEFIKKHRKGIIIAGLVGVGATLLAISANSNKKNRTQIEGETIEMEPIETEEGYGIWAMVNGKDPEAVRVSSELKKQSEENGIKMMCEVLE